MHCVEGLQINIKFEVHMRMMIKLSIGFFHPCFLTPLNEQGVDSKGEKERRSNMKIIPKIALSNI